MEKQLKFAKNLHIFNIFYDNKQETYFQYHSVHFVPNKYLKNLFTCVPTENYEQCDCNDDLHFRGADFIVVGGVVKVASPSISLQWITQSS